MDGIISLPICIAGFFLIPDLPENTRAFYLTEDVSTNSSSIGAEYSSLHLIGSQISKKPNG